MIPGLAAAGPGPCVQVTVRWEGSRWIQGDVGSAQILPGLRPRASFQLVEPGVSLSLPGLTNLSQAAPCLRYGWP